jgi:hypothetical protein
MEPLQIVDAVSAATAVGCEDDTMCPVCVKGAPNAGLLPVEHEGTGRPLIG